MSNYLTQCWNTLNWTLGNKLQRNFNSKQYIFITKMHLKMSSAKWRLFRFGLKELNKQRVLMHGHQGWNVRHGLCHIYMIYVYIWVVHSFCLFCCLFIIVTTQFVALYEPCKPKPKPSTYDTRTTTPWQRSKFRYLDRSQSNKYAINMQIQTISVSK